MQIFNKFRGMNPMGNFGTPIRGSGGSDPLYVLYADSVLTPEMRNAIVGWRDMYVGKSHWLKGDMRSEGLAAKIASSMAAKVTIEMDVRVKPKTKKDENGNDLPPTGSTRRSEWLDKQLDTFRKRKQTVTELACAMGNLVMVPSLAPGVTLDGEFRLYTNFVNGDSFFPLAFNPDGIVTSGFFRETLRRGSDITLRIYTRIEKHVFDERTNQVIIANTAYMSQSPGDLGTEVPLNEIAEWSNLAPVTVFENMEKPIFGYFRMPFGNIIDPDSPIGISVYARAIGLIMDADKQYTRLLWEYEAGEAGILASDTAFPKKNGLPIYPAGKERMFIRNSLDPKVNGTSDRLIQEWMPALRDEQYANGLNRIKMTIEKACGLASGSLAEIETVQPRTATEMALTHQETVVSITCIQMALEDALRDLVYGMDKIATQYGLVEEGEYEVTFHWDDSLVTDAESERLRDMSEVQQKLLADWEYRVKWLGETKEQAQESIEAIREVEKEKAEDAFSLGRVASGGFGFPRRGQENGKKKDKEDDKQEE